jgi:hypothetical protein
MGLWDDLTGKTASDAANAAAKKTEANQRTAIGGYNAYGDTLPGAYNALGAGYDPYKQAGTGALSMLMSGLGLGGQGGSAAFTNAYRGLPGYQAAMETGMRSGERALNASNMGQSGRAALELQRRGMGIEDQASGNYLAQLMGLSGQGMQATGAQAGLGAQGLGAQAAQRGSAFGGDMTAAGTIGQGMVAGAQAQQQGITNLLNAGTNLAGGALGGGWGGAATGAAKSLYNSNSPGTTSYAGYPWQGPR